MKKSNSGIFYIVATPIGNLEDISLRAISTLKQVDLIAAEDTRHSKKLLKYYSIATPMVSLHDYNEKHRSDFIHQQLALGKNIALISDAGTPLISDPGYHLVKYLRELDYKIVPIPGPCAAITALAASGLPTNEFLFLGFLPAKSSAQIHTLEKLVHEPRTTILYEAPHRLLQLIDNMLKVFGKNKEIALAKELTKTFETIYSAKLSAVKEWLAADSARQRGEFVILLAGTANPVQNTTEIAAAEKILKILADELPTKQAAALTAKITGLNKNELYQKALVRHECL